MMEPSYLKLHESGELHARAAKAALVAADAAEEYSTATDGAAASIDNLVLSEAAAKAQLDELHQLLSVNITDDFNTFRDKVRDINEDIGTWKARIALLQNQEYVSDGDLKEIDELLTRSEYEHYLESG